MAYPALYGGHSANASFLCMTLSFENKTKLMMGIECKQSLTFNWLIFVCLLLSIVEWGSGPILAVLQCQANP